MEQKIVTEAVEGDISEDASAASATQPHNTADLIPRLITKFQVSISKAEKPTIQKLLGDLINKVLSSSLNYHPLTKKHTS